MTVTRPLRGSGNNIPPEFVPAIQKGFREAIEKGPLTGSPVMGVRVVLEASSHVTVVSQSCHSRVIAV